MPDEQDVRRVAMPLPGVTEEGDRCTFEIDGETFARPWRERVRPRKPKVERRDVLVVPVDDENEKLARCASEPGIYFTEPHCDGYAMVLVRRDAIDGARLAESLADALEIVIETPARKRRGSGERLRVADPASGPLDAGEELAPARPAGDEHGLAQERPERQRVTIRTRRYTTM